LGIAADVAIIVTAGFVGGVLARLLKQPLILGYIAAGIVLGPVTGGVFISDPHDIELLAEIGIALLLFALGIEFSFKELRPVRSVAVFGAFIQIILTIAAAAAMGLFLGWPWSDAVWFGACISLSSTMVILKTLQGQGRLGTLSSRVMIGMLLVQDLMVVPLLILLPKMTDLRSGLPELGWALLYAVLFIGFMIVVGTRLIPWLMRRVSRWNSRELFLLTVTGLGLGIGYATYKVGLSFAFGAFIAGMVLSESEHAHQALSDIIPLRDIFGLLFFASVGMLLEPHFVRENLWLVLSLALAVSLVKGLICAGVGWTFGYRNVVPLALGLTMFQAGEFAFVIGKVGIATASIGAELYSIIMAVTLVTMLMTPFVSGATAPIYSFMRKRRPIEPTLTINITDEELHDHVVIVGAGNMGRTVAGVLARFDLPCVVIELDQHRLDYCRTAGQAVIYGDASHPVVLEAAGIKRARILLITTPSQVVTTSIARHVGELRPDLYIVARADSVELLAELQAIGVHKVVLPQMEAGLEVTRQALRHLEVPDEKLEQYVTEARREFYRPAPAATS